MGIIDRMKRTTTGPVTVDITVPDTFNWTDESLAVTVTPIHEADQPLEVVEVMFAFGARTSGTKERRPHG